MLCCQSVIRPVHHYADHTSEMSFEYDNMFGVLFFWAISPTPRLTEDPLLVLSRLIPAF